MEQADFMIWSASTEFMVWAAGLIVVCLFVGAAVAGTMDKEM